MTPSVTGPPSTVVTDGISVVDIPNGGVFARLSSVAAPIGGGGIWMKLIAENCDGNQSVNHWRIVSRNEVLTIVHQSLMSS